MPLHESHLSIPMPTLSSILLPGYSNIIQKKKNIYALLIQMDKFEIHANSVTNEIQLMQ